MPSLIRNLIRTIRKGPPKCAMPVTGAKPDSLFYGLPVQTSYVRRGNSWFLGGKKVTDVQAIERLNKMHLPPSWRSVHVSADKTAKLQAVGYDSAGRVQRRYNAAFAEAKAKEKFARVREFSRDLPKMREAVAKMDTPEAMLFKIEDRTVIRIGSTADRRAKVKSYGLTTLEGRHVKITGNRVHFDYIAKEGIRQQKTIQHADIAKWLQARKKAAGSAGRLFPDVSADKLNAFVKKMAGGKKYSVKDFRTFHASNIAYNRLRAYEGVVLSTKEKRELIKSVSEEVSRFLGNTPSMARKSYIDPMAWELIGGV